MSSHEIAPTEREKELAAWYLTGTHRLVWRAPLTLMLGVLLVLLLFRVRQEDLRARLPDALQAYVALAPTAVADADNAAIALRAVGVPGTLSLRLLPYAEVAPLVPASLSTTAESVAAAVSRPRCNWGVKYSDRARALMPHLTPNRNMARLLTFAIRTLGGTGRHAEAAKMLEANYRLACHTASDSILISGMVSQMIEHIGLNGLEATLLWEPPDDPADVARYRAVLHLQDRDLRKKLETWLDAERRFALLELCWRDAHGMVPERFEAEPAGWLLKSTHAAEYHNFVRAYPKFRERILRDDQLVPEEEELAALVQTDQQGPAFEVLSTFSEHARYVRSSKLRHEALLAFDAALAVRQFQLKYKRDPAQLSELVPEFLERVPVSPLSLTPIQLRSDNKGLTQDINGKHVRRFEKVLRVYGNGINCKDDLGYSWSEVREDMSSDDSVIRLQSFGTLEKEK